MTDSKPLVIHGLRSWVLFLGGILLGTTALVIAFVAWRVSGKTGCSVSSEDLVHPLKVCSPFSSRALNSPEEFTALFKLPIFPEAVGFERFDRTWVSQTSTGRAMSNGLFVIELRSRSPMADMETWYEKALQSSFRKSRATCEELGSSKQEWLPMVLETCAGTGTLFLADDQQRTIGALLSSPGIHEASVIRLFYYAQGRSRGSNR
jgi:hypothetical protein